MKWMKPNNLGSAFFYVNNGTLVEAELTNHTNYLFFPSPFTLECIFSKKLWPYNSVSAD